MHGLDIPVFVRRLSRKPTIRIESGRFVGNIENEPFILGNIVDGIGAAVQKMIKLRMEHAPARAFALREVIALSV